MKLKRILTAVLTGLLFITSVPAPEANADTYVPEGAVASVTVNGRTSYYYDNTTSGGAEAMWNTAMTGNSADVVLYADWLSYQGTRFGAGAGFIYDGVLNVPSGHEITIDLNGFSINRNLEFAVEHGEVIHVDDGAVLNIADTTAGQSGTCGSITGGNSSTGAGGIYIEAGGTVNLWGGYITGNQTEASGGGVLLAGQGSSLTMSSGKIFSNAAQQCGGGVAVSDGTFKLAGGELTDNTAQDGGGIYAQAGEVVISENSIVSQNTAVHGGGVLLNNTAAFTLKGKAVIQSNAASGENKVGGGILAMNSVPIKISGKPSVLNNSADGTPSNLVFWQNGDGKSELPCYLKDAGTGIEAKIGVSLAGNLREVVFAPEWKTSDCFICDTQEYVIESKDGNLILKRTFGSSLVGDKRMILLIITCVLIVLAVIAILLLLFRKNKSTDTDAEDETENTPVQEPEQPKKKKKTVVAAKKSKAKKQEIPPEIEEDEDEDDEEEYDDDYEEYDDDDDDQEYDNDDDYYEDDEYYEDEDDDEDYRK